MGDSTCLDAMYKFCKAVIAVFDKVYLREPTTKDTARLFYQRKEGFHGMLSNIDNFHGGWQGQRLEAVASHDLWIWHSFLECQDLAMISICSNGYRYLIGLLNAPLLRFPMRSSMVIIITKAII
jgi:hypothetical protein